MKLILFTIDPQVSFCCPRRGELYVNGAEDDMKRLAAFVDRAGDRLDDIVVTLDSHHLLDIAHPLFWKNSVGAQPAPFTIIGARDLEQGVWMPAVPGLYDRALDYVRKLEDGQRYPLCIWPPHCLIGTPGQTVLEPLAEALHRWEERNIAYVNYVTKGSNILTEHYSVIRAEVPDPGDPSTQVNTDLVTLLQTADRIILAGEALSHCLANSGRDLIREFGDDSYIKKLVLLTDATSSVSGFEQYGDAFIRDMRAKGMELSTTTDYLR
jgi:nicotinamidase/pyrazinamidase